MNTVSVLRVAALMAAASLPVWLHGQTISTPPPTPNPASSEPISLEAFTVNTSARKDDYIASEAMSGTRTGAKILEVPYNVQVITNEFMEDFQVFDENNYRPLQYIANYAPDNGGRLRGFMPLTLRDGFSRAGPSAISNTQQIEVIMGPQSTLYGNVSPGGIINYVSKQPKEIASTRVSVARGSYDFERYEVESTGPLVNKKLFYLADVSYIGNGSSMEYYYSHVMLYNLALTYRLSERTKISVFGEYQSQRQNGGSAFPDEVVGSKQSGTNPLNRTGGIDVGPYLPLAGFNQIGPDQRIERAFKNYNMRLEQQLGSAWVARLSVQYYDKAFHDNRWTTGINYIPETKRLTSHEPVVQTQDIETYAFQADLLGRFKTGDVRHALLFAADYTDDKYDNEQWQLPTTLRDALPDSQRFIDPANPDWTNYNFALVNRQTSWTTRDIAYQGYTGSYRTYMFNEKLITLLGLRYESIDSKVTNPLTPANRGNGSADSFGYSAGVNYKLIGDQLLLYGNYSTSFDTSTTVDQGTNQVQKPTRGRGPEAGFKGMFFNERIGYTASVFRTDQTDVAFANPAYTSALAGTGVPQYLSHGSVRIKGAEFSLSARLTDALTVIGNVGYLDARTTQSATQSLVGDTLTGIPSKTGSLAARYSFLNGALKGLRVGASVTYTGSRLTDLGSASSLRAAVGTVQNYSAFATYEWRTDRWRHSINLNVQNAFDKFYITAADKLGDGRNIRVTYRLGF